MTGRISWKNGDIYEYRVMEYLQRRGIELEDMILKNGNGALSHHYFDIEVPKLNLKIEVKGSLLHYRNGMEGTFAFNKESKHRKSNLFAFVFGKEGFVLFLTRSEFLDIIGRSWKNSRKSKHTRIKLIDIYDKALNLRYIYNW